MWLTPSNSPTGFSCRTVFIPDDLEWVSCFTGAILELTYPYNWQPFGAVSVDDVVGVMSDVLNSFLDGENCMIGMVFPFVTDQPPQNALLCDGASYSRWDYPVLYSRLDAAFVVDANTFKTPDLRGRTVVGAGIGVGLTARDVGAIDGQETHVLTVDEMPAHSHQYEHPIPNIDVESAGVPDPVAVGQPFYNADTSSTGNGEPHNNMQPFLALKYAIVAR